MDRSEKIFSSIFKQNSSVQLLINPKNGDIIDANEAACKFYGFSYQDMISMKIYEINQYDKKNVKKFMSFALDKNRNYFQFKHKIFDGSIRDVEVYSTPIKIKEKQLLISIVHDITEKKEYENLLKSYIEYAPYGVFIADQNGNFIDTNSEATKITGYKKDEILKMKVSKMVVEEDRERSLKHFEKTKKEGKANGEFRFITKMGKKRSFSVNSIKISDEKYLGFIQDITEQKNYESVLKKAKDKAEESNRLKSEFLRNMSHEVRTPMNGIIGFSTLLEDSTLTFEERFEYIKVIQESGFKLLKIIDSILEISMLDTKEVKLEKTEFNLNRLIDEICFEYRSNLKNKNIKFSIKKGLKDEQSFIICDKTKLSRALENIVNNSFKFTSEGFIKVGYFIENEKIIIYVKDSGIGILSENIDIIFRRFSKEDKNISPEYGGLGLGLSISERNIKIIGGEISCKSKKGEGSTFYIKIPYIPAKK